jgi:hypothetical protein
LTMATAIQDRNKIATEHRSRKTHRTIDTAERLQRDELESIEFDGWVLSRVIDMTSKAGRPYVRYKFNRAAEPARRSA